LKKRFNLCSEFFVKDDFKIVDDGKTRVNVIGFSSKKRSETGITIDYNKLYKRYAVDNSNKSFRVEFYKDGKFCAMSIVHFE
jgi:hypothetical protein